MFILPSSENLYCIGEFHWKGFSYGWSSGNCPREKCVSNQENTVFSWYNQCVESFHVVWDFCSWISYRIKTDNSNNYWLHCIICKRNFMCQFTQSEILKIVKNLFISHHLWICYSTASSWKNFNIQPLFLSDLFSNIYLCLIILYHSNILIIFQLWHLFSIETYLL